MAITSPPASFYFPPSDSIHQANHEDRKNSLRSLFSFVSTATIDRALTLAKPLLTAPGVAEVRPSYSLPGGVHGQVVETDGPTDNIHVAEEIKKDRAKEQRAKGACLRGLHAETCGPNPASYLLYK